MKMVHTPEQVAGDLDGFLNSYLPAAQYLDLKVHSFDGEQLQLAMGLQPSINDKLTAFGGSLYCQCVMNCWGMVYLQCRLRDIEPNIVVSHGEIDYLKPVAVDPILSRCDGNTLDQWDQFFDEYAERGRAKIELHSSITTDEGEAVRFSGRYAILGQKN